MSQSGSENRPAAQGRYISQPTADSGAGQSPPQRPTGASAKGMDGPMQTAMQQFADDFAGGIQPLLEPIAQAADALAAASDSCKPKTLLPNLRELRHHLASLVDKVADQQAYVLIFGPLKSGKSTFMNALCGSYVSEVTALPAYPCLVHVAGGQTERFSLTRYDGSAETVSNRHRLEQQIETAHRSLTERIRQVEGEGEDFDPAEHMPSAIRRIDVRLPLEKLLQSGAVLVDTPGLYTRMKFGYDRMTREFRNSAACAIFIVKTDTLFLEQVFDEFGQLLQLFSRVFLVVNLDQAKKDLQPDGSLEPSLESRQPEQILQAFRDLTMSGPLRQAADSGRLRIYGVDLLTAASQRIQGTTGKEKDAPAAGQFGQLVGDLTDYLNSSEYLREFLSDSLRRTRSLLGELGQLMEDESVRDLYEQRRMLRQDRQQTRKQLEAIGRLGKMAWPRQKQLLQQRLAEALVGQADKLQKQTDRELQAAIDTWFESPDSLAELNQQTIRPMLRAARGRMVEVASEQLSRQLKSRHAGLDITDDVAADLAAAEIELETMAEKALAASNPDQALQTNGFGITARSIPVKRRMRDWLLLRSRRKVRRRLLGGEDQPEASIPPAAKQKQIGQPGREAMLQRVGEQLQQLVAEASQSLSGRLAELAIESMQGQFKQQLAARQIQGETQARQTEALLAEAEAVARQTDKLRQAVNDASLAAEEMNETFVACQRDETVEAIEATEQS